MEIIQENTYAYVMKSEVEPYLKERCQDQKNGNGLHVRSYQADNPKGVIVISHGFTEGAPKYDEVIYYFLKAGYHVYMPEHMGHGSSYRLTDDPSLVHVDIWRRYVRDFLNVCHEIKRTYPGLPLNLFAHSMGGAIGAIAASWEPELFHKVILNSPMIQPLTGGVPWPFVILIAHLECLLGRSEKYAAGQKPYAGSETFETSAATCETRFARYNEIKKSRKELQTSAPSYGWLKASVKMSWYLRYHGWKKIAAPILIFQAEQDDYVSVRAMKRFAEKIKKVKHTSCEYVPVRGTKHEIFYSGDDIMKAYMERILDFLD